ncbi:MAG: type II toxin-antitoxin system HicB family antitoxin [Gammaproteobacteria bacterium]|nr:type II toxin-antitoxin system HicB family antitoxin [Gammaproteobacteria bacterium]
MDQTWTAVVSYEEGWWVGWIAEVPGVNAQERSREQLLASLTEVLREALEMNRRDAMAQAPGSETVAVAL